jgi:hypothetical protein
MNKKFFKIRRYLLKQKNFVKICLHLLNKYRVRYGTKFKNVTGTYYEEPLET